MTTTPPRDRLDPNVERLGLLLRAALTYAAANPNLGPEATYCRLDHPAQLRSRGRRALAYHGHDPVLPDWAEALMNAIVRSHPTRKNPPMNPDTTCSNVLRDSRDEALLELVTELASYLDQRTRARLHAARGLTKTSSEHGNAAEEHHQRATALLTSMLPASTRNGESP
ncbi:hypothetical protein [Phytomonospora endophytica]|uniref:Uncharacterized protein n=1 Tax=Phytomonospora endophytica TaxID=714109 RepID=A0A841FK95_9ACTN|nr:hypothetical protein [Phytomonospora endophytica]MBB6037751.1 hypothetical protein [Phytomonospora endophytica]GIG67721.1 hypothetical protein Pen01_40160 [Phytomonospora endophytica]